MSILTRLTELEARVKSLESDEPDFKYSRDKNNTATHNQDISMIKELIGIEGDNEDHEL